MQPARLVSLCALAVCLPTAVALVAQQKAAPSQAPEQQKLKERVDELDSREKADAEKADRAAMQKDYIERIQTDTKAYYEKAFNSQIFIVTIMGLFLAAVGKFGVDHVVQSKLTEALADLREEFRKTIAEELQKLKDSNAAETNRLKEKVEATINELARDARVRSNYQFRFSQGLVAAVTERHSDAKTNFRAALMEYKPGRNQQVLRKASGVICIKNIFQMIDNEDHATRVEKAKAELADPLYNDLEEELALAALELDWIAPLVSERKPTPQPPQPVAASTAPEEN
jgi:hypothetical protein